MMIKWSVMALLGALAASSTAAAELPSLFGDSPHSLQRWSLMRGGENGVTGDAEADAAEQESGKSAGWALVLSGFVPGAGQYYMGGKKKAVAFFGVEALLWWRYLSGRSEGHDIEKTFRALADEHWNPQDYIEWRVLPSSRSSITHSLPCSSSVANANPSLYIGAVTEAIRDCKDTEKQQYYELIGKYHQFVAGWSDLKDERGVSVEPAQIDSVENYVSERRLKYEKLRHDSNTPLKGGIWFLGGILFNHAFSAIDASRMARLRSKGVEEARLERRTRFVFSLHRGSRGQVPMVTAYKPF